MIAAATRAAQRSATDPAASAWVSANAGSGKTYVLTRRVIRLLLAGTDPSRILCLTFTKAAAAEMANRVFAMLGAWATMPEDQLVAAVADVEGAAPGRQRLTEARRLFARALETPGGLKIQTIHAFCEALLQRFPIEADLPGRFVVLEERQSVLLVAEARASAIRDAVAAPRTPLGDALATLLRERSDFVVETAINGVLKKREAFRAFVQPFGSLDAALATLPAALGVPAGVTREGLLAAAAASPVFGADVITRLLPVLERASSTMIRLAADLEAAANETDADRRRPLWRALFLTKEGQPRAKPVTDAVEAALPGTRDVFSAEAARLVALDDALAALETAEMTAAIIRLADRVAGHYQAAKRAAGALDFDDLIQRVAALLSRSEAAIWVQYKLDEGLDHVLVDEAQDTSPLQWQIVKALTGDFFAGEGARGRRSRTVFAVGDEKQSIYSFQNADPALFADSGSFFSKLARGAGGVFNDVRLNVSFRSTADVVKAVDRVFAAPEAHAGLMRDAGPTVHETSRTGQPGLVEIWPEIEPEETPKPEHWEDPVDRAGAGSPALRLAARIADEIAAWLRGGERLAASGKLIRPGDILVLVKKRGPFVEALNRGLKERGIPVAGADRLDVLGHIVAKDLLAAAKVSLLPDDDLTLAAFARSPLVPGLEEARSGLSEEALFRLAHGRGRQSLWSRVCDLAASGDTDAARLAARVDTLLARAGRGDPYRFFAALVTEDGGRAVFRARIGREADEVIDEFLALVLGAEDRGAGSLAAFIALAAEAREEIKREVDGQRDEVRVMTVHGAKGLEAPVVFLVDPGSPPSSSRFDPAVVVLGKAPGAPLVWVQPGRKPQAVDAVLQAHRQSEEAEYRRLLYVGLTRAADRLVICGMKNKASPAGGRWHSLVTNALGAEADVVAAEDGSVERWRWRATTDAGRRPADVEADTAPPPLPLPGFLTRIAETTVPPRALTPSSAAAMLDPDEAETESARRSGRDALDRARGMEAKAARRGTLVHRLFELLPQLDAPSRERRAHAFLARGGAELGEAERSEIVDSVLDVIGDARWSAVFGPQSRAEVAIAGSVPGLDGRLIPVFGQIDRLATTSEGYFIVDFKTARQVPDVVPESYAIQLALYRALLARLSPGCLVRAAILWTEVPRLDEISAGRMDALVTRLVTNMGSSSAVPRP